MVKDRDFPSERQESQRAIARPTRAKPYSTSEVVPEQLEQSPPDITLVEVMGGQTRLHYRSERNLCRLVEGLLVGVARHFGKKVSYQQEQCVHEGAKSCVFLVSFY